jgi:hypothetical protein
VQRSDKDYALRFQREHANFDPRKIQTPSPIHMKICNFDYICNIFEPVKFGWNPFAAGRSAHKYRLIHGCFHIGFHIRPDSPYLPGKGISVVSHGPHSTAG